jgi:hypothetical protein
MTETVDQRGRRALRLVVILLFSSVGVSLVFGALTLIFRNDVLAYQLAHQPGADRGGLERTLWTRPVPIVVVAGLYVGVARQLLRGNHRAYRRVRIVSVLGLAGVGWLLAGAEYPSWLRIVQIGQLAVLGALVVAANRRTVREQFSGKPTPDPRPRNRRAAWTLILLAPVVAEVSIGNIGLRDAWVILVFIPIYGAGALLIREVVRRTGGGIGALLLMGVAYGLIEEGLALQSLTSPRLYGAAGWAPRIWGLNTAYTEVNLVYHAVFSVTVPILLVELIFGSGPYVRRGGLITSGVVALAGAGLIRLSVPLSQDPGYQMPLPAIVIIAALAAGIVVVALRMRAGPDEPAGTPGPAVVGVLSGVAAFTFLALLWPFAGATQSFFTHGDWALLPMAAAAVLATATGLALRRWSRAWTRTHLLTACLGAVTGHTIFGLVGNAETAADRIFLGVLAALTAAVAVRYERRHRTPRPVTVTDPARVPAVVEDLRRGP